VDGTLKLFCHVDVDFEGLVGSADPAYPALFVSRTGYLIKFGIAILNSWKYLDLLLCLVMVILVRMQCTYK